MILRRLALIGALVLVVVGPPARAHAGDGPNAYVSGSTLYYLADAGVANAVRIRLVGDYYSIDDQVPIDAGIGCEFPTADRTFVSCLATSVTTVWVETYDLDDSVDYLTPTHSAIRGGDGNDGIWGGTGSDSLFGGPGSDSLNGWDGDDWVTGGTGTDRLAGGGGSWDVVTYGDSPVGVTVDLDGVADDGAPGENDQIINDIEVLLGSPHGDTLSGDDNSNHIYGGAGNDVLYGRGGNDYLYGDGFCDFVNGADFLFGGSGRDTASYSDHTAAQRVFADLDGALGDDGAPGEGDSIASDVENISGTAGPDFITGNAEANTVWGGAGNDVITGLAGQDTLDGEGGSDTIYGGDGDDLLYGRQGDDSLYGQRDADDLYGQDGTDTCELGSGGHATFDCEG